MASQLSFLFATLSNRDGMDVTYSEMHSVLCRRQLRPNRTIDKAQFMTAYLIVFPALRQCMPAQKVTGLVFHISRAY